MLYEHWLISLIRMRRNARKYQSRSKTTCGRNLRNPKNPYGLFQIRLSKHRTAFIGCIIHYARTYTSPAIRSISLTVWTRTKKIENAVFKDFTVALEFLARIDYNIGVDKKESTHSKSGCHYGMFIALTGNAHPVCQTGWAYFLRLFLLSRKAISAITKPPKDMSKPNIPKITITVS